ncbi:MAG: hypothetical protein ACRCYY_05020 [Trueperaceae bacterium]
MKIIDFDLCNPKEFHSWYYAELSHGSSPDEILKYLSRDQTQWSFCRQMCVAHWADLKDVRDTLTNKCLFSGEFLVEAYAISFDVYRQVALVDTAKDGFNLLAHQYLPMLNGYISKISALERTPFVCEVEASLRSAVAMVYFDTSNVQQAAEECSLAIFWIKKVGADFLLSKCQSLLVTINAKSGGLVDAIETIKSERKNPSRAKVSVAFQERVFAEFLFDLGHNEVSLELLTQLECEVGPRSKRLVRNSVSRFSCLMGLDDGKEGADQDFSGDPRGWIIQSVGNLVKVGSLPVSSQTQKQRDDLLHNAVKIWRDASDDGYLYLSTIGHLITGTANLWLGQTSLALVALEKISSKVSTSQWYDLRIRKAGLGLELSLSLQSPGLNPQVYVDELNRIFCEVDSIPIASRKGLIQRLTRWYPSAAAFFALAPSGLGFAELQPATRAIIFAGYRNSVNGVLLPPPYIAELICRSLDLDKIPNYHFTQADIGGGKMRRNQLKIKYGNVDYWLPTISSVKMIYGLKKMGESETALRVSSEYGVVPHTSSQYVMMPLLERINNSTQDLLLDRITASEFSKNLVIPD